ncbi:MAG: beta-lactamase family protein [Actinomycetia bacterium]|nr:beta-lactamase family protein [Actinomycetes bacterium]MCP4959718.1 beta-lactamase family protein [Actinomycetes bacterium]
MDGFSHPAFDNVASTFRQQLRRTGGGAAVAIYHRGELVVDLWGGARTVEGDPWQADTLAMCFSTTKGVASFALHLQVEAGLVDYDEPVATYWPEFAQNGKENVTVRHVLTHSAGLHRIRSVIENAHHMLDWEHMVEALAAEPPAYEPGTRSGYHALTYGWLVGEIVRRVTGRPLADVIAQDVAAPLGSDGLFLGCPPEERHRVAPLAPLGTHGPNPPKALQAINRHVGKQFGRALSLAGSPVNPRRIINALIPRGMEDVVASTEIMDAAIPAANGFFTARALADMYALLAGGGALGDVRLLSPELVVQIGEQQNNRRDLVLVMPMRWRLGYHRVPGTRGACPDALGHFGFGGSGAFADPSRDLAVAMVCNRGTGTPIGDARLVRLSRVAIACADGHGVSDAAA